MTALSAGDATCPYGGSRFSVGAATATACNGAPGAMGPPGSGSGGGSGSTPGGAGNEGFSLAGMTVGIYAGNLGGVQGAHAKCAAEFSGSHLCTAREYELIGAATPIPPSGAWIDGSRYLSSSAPAVTPRDRDTTYTCNSWRSSTATYSAWIDTFGDYTYSNVVNSCATARPLLCCRAPQSNWVRGFTSLTSNGNLGGIQGANAKCAAEFPGAHLCTSREYELAGSAQPVPPGGAWIDGARYLSSSAPSVTPRDRDTTYTCNSWRSGTATYSAWIDPFGDYTYSNVASSCGVVRPLACCSN